MGVGASHGPTTGRYEQLLERQRADLRDGYLAGVRRLRWSAERLAEERTRRLQALLGYAADRSSFWRGRLAGRDLSHFTEADLPSLPVLTKAEMMAQFDRLVTAPELTLARVNEHVDRYEEDAYLDDRYRVVATSGSGGQRAVVVYDWDEWVTFAVVATRWGGRCGDDPQAPLGSFYAASPRHVSGALHAFAGLEGGGGAVHLPATLPLPEIVAGLNEAQPTQLQGYPSVIRLLALEALAGRLTVKPTWVSTCGEQCTEEVRRAVQEAWGTEIADIYGCSEGVYAFPCGVGEGMHLPDDLAILEPVDAEGKPVPHGEPAARVLLTNLYNRTQPLIRYEITDALTILDDECPCGCAHRRLTDIRGRTDGFFRYPNGAVVQCVGLASILLADGGVADMHVVQTERGLEASVTARGRCDREGIAGAMADLLRRSGVDDPVVEVRVVDALDRLWSGKVRQFEPLR